MCKVPIMINTSSYQSVIWMDDDDSSQQEFVDAYQVSMNRIWKSAMSIIQSNWKTIVRGEYRK